MAHFSVCVYCGSRFGADPAYRDAAEEMGRALAAQNWRLVYGAGDVGLMGAVATATQQSGGETFGVIPIHLMKREVGKRDLSSFIVTENMHERKKVMYMNSDAIVVLPGGAGSMDEFFEVLTWRQLGLHEKPIILLNTNGYWTPLVDLMKHIVDQEFADANVLDFVELIDTVPEAIQRLKQSDV
ncbi:LOG family protein [Cochlodiniinecator piscidefendens]|uniref:LOG family protein n=1 Tax=Cochlodiniinecator piscidefendens TaxID=2715756 RepID=UPI00140A5596|nr:TIGR00730 family Rossman fold protein [Cochlodiniinecator piscidefendens]